MAGAHRQQQYVVQRRFWLRRIPGVEHLGQRAHARVVAVKSSVDKPVDRRKIRNGRGRVQCNLPCEELTVDVRSVEIMEELRFPPAYAAHAPVTGTTPVVEIER